MEIVCNSALLEAEEENMLRHYAALPFALGGYDSLDDIVTSLGIKVVVKEGICDTWVPDELVDTSIFWQCIGDSLEDEVKGLRKYSQKKQRYWHARAEQKRIDEEIAMWQDMERMGYYDAEKNLIVLFPEMVDAVTAKNAFRGIIPYNNFCDEKVKYNSFYRSAWAERMLTAFVRAVMHAYFSRYGHANAPYLPFIEEPLAEFGVLLYLKKTHSVFYHWAYADIKDMPTCHRYGIDIINLYNKDCKKRELIFDFFEHYRDDMSLVSAESVRETDAATRVYNLIEQMIQC